MMSTVRYFSPFKKKSINDIVFPSFLLLATGLTSCSLGFSMKPGCFQADPRVGFDVKSSDIRRQGDPCNEMPPTFSIKVIRE